MQIDPQVFLDTEASIIAENDAHIVVALRFEKAVFARNLLFLSALADLIPERSEKCPAS